LPHVPPFILPCEAGEVARVAGRRGLSPPPPTFHSAAIIAAKINPSDTSVSGCILCAMSLLHPPPGFPPHLCVIWPLIWVQILVLRAAVRAAYGRGTQYHWSVTPCGRVFITSIDWIPGQKAEREWLKPSAHSSAWLAAALDGSAFTPAYSNMNPLSLGRGVGVRGGGVSAGSARADKAWPLIPNPFSPRRRGLGLPLPEI
jgi:hypothetical protein